MRALVNFCSRSSWEYGNGGSPRVLSCNVLKVSVTVLSSVMACVKWVALSTESTSAYEYQLEPAGRGRNGLRLYTHFECSHRPSVDVHPNLREKERRTSHHLGVFATLYLGDAHTFTRGRRWLYSHTDRGGANCFPFATVGVHRIQRPGACNARHEQITSR